MNDFSTSPAAAFRSVWRNRMLILQMARREIVAKYKGSVFGLAWSLATPLFMLAVYTFVFSIIFQARWPRAESKLEFSSVMFTGLIIYSFFAEFMARAPGLILGNVNYVKKVVFPLEVLPWIALLNSLFHALISFAVLCAFLVFLKGGLHWTILLLPVILLPLMLLMVGLSLFLASIGTFFRDIGQSIGLVLSGMMFLSPIFYPSTAFPEEYRFVLYLNPLTFIIEEARAVALWGEMPNWAGLGLYLVCSLIILWAGFAWFQKTRKGFADVL